MANRETREVHIKVTSNEKGMKTANKPTNKLKGGLSGVASAASAATGGIRAMAMALVSSGIGAVVLALGSMVAFLGKTMSLSRNFEKSLSRLGAITGATADDMTRLSDSAQKFGASTEFTASQVVEMQTELAKLGFNTEEILAATGGALSLASAAGTGLAEAAEVTAGVLNGFGMAASDIGEVVDVMAMSFNSSALDMEKFRESMKMVAPIASTVGESVASTTAALGVLADNQIAGSMAGTNLRKVLMGLEKEFGGGLATQLDSFKERLDTATTRNQKLEMATKLVGERMAGALIILAENNEKYDELKVKLDGASEAYDGLGAAQNMANKQLDNLDGDLKILNSTWEGFMLGIEDGNGAMNSLARKGVQLLTNAINGLNKGAERVSFYFTDLREGLKEASVGIGATVVGLFTKMRLKIEEFVTKAKLKMSEVPLIGGAIDEEAAKANLKRIEEDLSKANALIDKGAEYRSKSVARAGTAEIRFQQEYNKITEDIRTKARIKKEAETEEEEAKEDENNKASISKRKAFLEKLAKAEADQEAKTQAEKIELARQRHLDELAKIEMNTTEKREAEARINAIYDDKQKELRKQKELEADKERADQLIKKSEEQITELEKENGDFENRLMRLDAQKTLILMNEDLTEQQRTEILAKNAAARTRVEEAQADAKVAVLSKVAGYMSGFADLAGKNTEEGKAIAVATALINTYAGMSEVWSKKGSSPFVSASIAEKIAASAMVLGTGMKTIKSIKSVKVPKGGGGSGGGATPTGVQAPSFNVIGQTSVGEQLIADAVGQSNQQPVQAYVVESQMTSAQELNRNVEENASLG